jgi:hypothetical protein
MVEGNAFPLATDQFERRLDRATFAAVVGRVALSAIGIAGFNSIHFVPI